MKRNILLTLSLGMIFILLQPSFTAAESTTMYYDSLSNVNVDGKVTSGEYPTQLAIQDLDGNDFVVLHWAHNSTHIAGAVEMTTKGFVAIGFNDEGLGMTGADMIIAVKNSTDGSFNVNDYHATGNSAPLKDDNEDNLVAGEANEASGTTTMEFVIKLSSTDTQDKKLEVGGTYAFFLATEPNSDTLTYHGNHRTDIHTFTIADEGEEAPGETLEWESSFNAAFIAMAIALPAFVILRRKH